ncbi:hypothetical protein [Kitasatospora purpeofusca]|uniref:hypothetical protein n=1 Tax=Kitasatospora purpeofusca TaxID=67352 RepID=UPI0036475B5A
MGAALARVRRRLGWRGTALLACGVPWVVYGAGLVTTTREGIVRATVALSGLWALPGWGVVWMCCGVLACVAAARPSGRDMWGFAVAAAPPLIWTLAYVAAAVRGEYRAAWASVPLLLAPVLLLLVVAEVTGRRRRICTCERGRPGGR